jgi:catechol 2,3-dioxygenase-like lactoylglutathione lyase family enzyme
VAKRSGSRVVMRGGRLSSHATVLLVEDVRTAADYYGEALGFDVEFRVRDPDGYILAFGAR